MKKAKDIMEDGLKFNIGDLAKYANVKTATIRFYERKGLIDPAPRGESSGYRLYSSDVAKRVYFIRNAQKLGFTLREIKDLLLLRHNGTATCKDFRHKMEFKIAELDSKIKNMQKIKNTLLKTFTCCDGIDNGASNCPSLEQLELKNDDNSNDSWQ